MADSITVTEQLGARMTRVASFLVTGKFISLIINLITFVIIARIIGPSSYGIYTIIMSIISLFAGFGNPNLGGFISERVPKLISAKKPTEAKLVFGDTLLLTVFLGVALTAVAIASGSLLSTYALHNSSYTLTLDVGLLIILFSLLYYTLNYHLLSLNKGRSLAISAILHAVTQAVFGITLVFLGFGIIGAISGFLFGLIFGSAYELYAIKTSIGIKISLNNFSKRIKKILNFSKDLALSNILYMATSNFSVIFLGLIVSSSLVGYYGIASKIGSLIDVFVGAISLAILPMFSEAIYRKKQGANPGKLFYFSIYLSLLFGIPMITVVLIFAKEIILLSLYTSYLSAVPYMQLISIGIMIGIFGNYGTNFLISSSKQSKILKFTAITMLGEAISLFILTPIFGVLGMIIATVYVGSILSSVLYLNYLSKQGVILHKNKLLLLLLSNLIFAAIILPLNYIPFPSIGLLMGVILSFVLYPIIAGKLNAITKKDVEIIKKASAGVPIFGKILAYIASYTIKFCN